MRRAVRRAAEHQVVLGQGARSAPVDPPEPLQPGPGGAQVGQHLGLGGQRVGPPALVQCAEPPGCVPASPPSQIPARHSR